MSDQESLSLLLLKTVDFAAKKHKDQRRKDKGATPYINHPIGVAKNIIEIGRVSDPVILQAALLHDTIEDTATTQEELREEFGDKVTDVVLEVTDDKSLPKAERKRQQVEHSKHISKEAKTVKLSDKLYNLSDIIDNLPPTWSLETAQGYFVWGKTVVDQIRGTNKPLEDKLDQLFKSRIIYHGISYPVIPCNNLEEEQEFLTRYYNSMKD
eukprot:gene6146-7656_t